MATNAIIAVKTSNNEYTAVVVTFGSEAMQPQLRDNYGTPELAKELVSMGNIRNLGSRIHPNGPHSIYEREYDTTIFFARDSGEQLVDYKFANQHQVLDWAWVHGIRFAYFYSGKKWVSSLVK